MSITTEALGGEYTPEAIEPNRFEVPEAERPTVDQYIEKFDQFFSYDLKDITAANKEIHSVGLGRRRAEVVRYEQFGDAVRSLEIPLGIDPTTGEHSAVAVSVIVKSDGTVEANKETFTWRPLSNGERLIISGHKKTFDRGDYRFIKVAGLSMYALRRRSSLYQAS